MIWNIKGCDVLLDAEAAYAEASKELHGEFGRLQ